MLFDLDDTLLDRDQAVDKLFSLILANCYKEVEYPSKGKMLKRFKEYDKSCYGDNNKTKVLEPFFDEFPPNDRIPTHSIQDFWNTNFPYCFSVSQQTVNIIDSIKRHVKVAIITNGTTQRQKAKIINTNLNRYFDTIIISEEVGFSKPDKRIFELALNRLEVPAESALFIGDDMEKDIGGCQNININGIWFNPHMIKNDTVIKPYDEINSFDRLLNYLT
ncbi:HAD family hydrolase [Lederbergia lenta]|uniref:HAD family hydrolase n=1 Tax=Lederbergia lenta TaxID=1467 RepID=A0A2X4W9G9_LEDLE|nr:HAD-IA family hydrolase [Lederbergia lenta]MCM3109804.1 HAD-IA family hydrolase [Lederbergia lenta]MEC2324446.1 HAD-IA family hydrolase [Lederbergia lenta]SQI59831.1 HAD family hydrolase [Lederbergia lenta]